MYLKVILVTLNHLHNIKYFIIISEELKWEIYSLVKILMVSKCIKREFWSIQQFKLLRAGLSTSGQT